MISLNEPIAVVMAAPGHFVPGVSPAIHAMLVEKKTWMPGTRPGMTV
jgi:hypothetical protein